MILSLLTTLLGCGDGKPGIFSPNGYHIGKEKVWYKTSTGTWYAATELTDADASTFELKTLKSKISAENVLLGMDKNSIFWAGVKMQGVERASFEFLSGPFSKDKNAVYFNAQRLTTDVAHFQLIDRQFAKDSRAVYFGGTVFSEDPDHFERVGEAGSGYFKDRRHCWFDIYPIQGADPASFHYLGLNTAADAQHVYHEMNEVEGADQQTYQILDHAYAKDAQNAYRLGQRIVGAQAASFRVLNAYYSLDAQHCYYFLSPIPEAAPATFEIIDAYYAKDDQQVFLAEKPLEGADPHTFRVIDGPAGRSRDARFEYLMEKRVQ